MDDDGPSSIAVTIDCAEWSIALSDPETLIRRAVEATRAAVVPGTWLADAEVDVSLTDDAALQGLNAEWRGTPAPTNVLSFPLLDLTPGAWPARPPGPVLLGDVVLAYQTIAQEAHHLGRPLADHVVHLTVHGTLHLLGYDHQQAGEAELMEDLERQILAGLGIADPYAAPPQERGFSEMAR